ncbi:hypothetical protein HQ853_06690 [Enterococcus faecium]|nr:hypothetical protein [Enterococcus faecium]
MSELVIIIFVSTLTSIVISFFMMNFYGRMINKWMDTFFEEEENLIKKYLLIKSKGDSE